MSLYRPTHESQYAPGASAITRRAGCTWTTGATGADAATGGRKDRTPDYIHSLVKNSEESTPGTPGWSLPDLAKAMKRLGVGFEIRTGQGWGGVVAAHDDGLYIVIQGDSDQFGNRTCSGAFDGPHCVGVRPGGTSKAWPLDDPVCPAVRSESPAVIRRYAEKLWTPVLFGVFTDPVPHDSLVAVIPKGREFALFKVADHDDRPLRIIDSTTRTTAKGRRMPCSGRLPAVAGAGWPHRPPPDGLVRLRRAVGEWSYVDSRWARETK